VERSHVHDLDACTSLVELECSEDDTGDQWVDACAGDVRQPSIGLVRERQLARTAEAARRVALVAARRVALVDELLDPTSEPVPASWATTSSGSSALVIRSALVDHGESTATAKSARRTPTAAIDTFLARHGGERRGRSGTIRTVYWPTPAPSRSHLRALTTYCSDSGAASARSTRASTSRWSRKDKPDEDEAAEGLASFRPATLGLPSQLGREQWIRLPPETMAGIQIVGGRADAEVRAAYVRFARWLRAERSFPTRLPVYLNPGPLVRSPAGFLVVGVFFGPYDRTQVPFISLATGDYRDLRRTLGRDDALASLLFTLCHELQHYDQWCTRRPQVERGVNAAARKLLHRYSAVTEHP
jgi:hypothetical protein